MGNTVKFWVVLGPPHHLLQVVELSSTNIKTNTLTFSLEPESLSMVEIVLRAELVLHKP